MSSLFDIIFEIVRDTQRCSSHGHHSGVAVSGANSIAQIPEWDSSWRQPASATDADALLDRIQKLELAVEALIGLLGQRTGLRKEELAIAIQRLDLADGFEDGVAGPDRTAKAPHCGACRRPRNPARDSCLYCGDTHQPLVPTASARTAQPPVPQRMTTCPGCGDEVPERDTYFTENGLRCSACFTAASGEPG